MKEMLLNRIMVRQVSFRRYDIPYIIKYTCRAVISAILQVDL